MEKYGFIYLWYDKKRKMYYVGCHCGNVNDGYICSSNRMRDAYRRRPYDFKRRILKSNIDQNVLLDEEYKWLELIKENELGKKYYNLRKHKWGHWSTDENKRLTVGQKISASPNRNANISKANKGKISHTETSKEKLRIANKRQFEDPKMRELFSNKSKSLWQDPEYRRINTENKKGRKQSEETIRKRYETISITGNKGGVKKGTPSPLKGKTLPHLHGTRWFNNGVINVKRKECPEGFVPGRMKKGTIL